MAVGGKGAPHVPRLKIVLLECCVHEHHIPNPKVRVYPKQNATDFDISNASASSHEQHQMKHCESIFCTTAGSDPSFNVANRNGSDEERGY